MLVLEGTLKIGICVYINFIEDGELYSIVLKKQSIFTEYTVTVYNLGSDNLTACGIVDAAHQIIPLGITDW